MKVMFCPSPSPLFIVNFFAWDGWLVGWLVGYTTARRAEDVDVLVVGLVVI